MLKNSRAPYKCEQIANNQETAKKTQKKTGQNEKTALEIAENLKKRQSDVESFSLRSGLSNDMRFA